MTCHSARRMISRRSAALASRTKRALSPYPSGLTASASSRGRFGTPVTRKEPTRTEVEGALALARELYEAMLAKLPPELRP